jgi:hypothetical protein
VIVETLRRQAVLMISALTREAGVLDKLYGGVNPLKARLASIPVNRPGC